MLLFRDVAKLKLASLWHPKSSTIERLSRLFTERLKVLFPRFQFGLALVWLTQILSSSAISAEPSYIRDVQPILRKYCGGCHNEADKEGDFSVASFAAVIKGTPDAEVVKPGDAKNSRLLRLIQGVDEPKMPLRKRLSQRHKKYKYSLPGLQQVPRTTPA